MTESNYDRSAGASCTENAQNGGKPMFLPRSGLWTRSLFTLVPGCSVTENRIVKFSEVTNPDWLLRASIVTTDAAQPGAGCAQHPSLKNAVAHRNPKGSM